MSVERHPLSWPATWRRTPAAKRQRARFGSVSRKFGTPHQRPDGGTMTPSWNVRSRVSVHNALKRLSDELERLGAADALVSSNLPVRLDGMPRSGAGEPDDPGVAVYFRLRREQRVLACDRWDRVADNIAAIAAHISAIRAVDRYGVGTLEQAFAGYAALPAPQAPTSWRAVLNYGDEPVDVERVRRFYVDAARRAHPDAGGSDEQMRVVNAARDQALAEAVRQ